MKLVIEIDNEHYERIMRFEEGVTVYPTTLALYEAVKNGTPLPKGHNENNDYAECDQFVCSECGIELQDWHRVERDIDDGDISYHEYTFRYCPNCGTIIEAEEG